MCGTISMCQESKDGKIEVRYSKTRNRYKTVEINKNTLQITEKRWKYTKTKKLQVGKKQW